MLSPYRVLDLTNERGILCGQMLADLGADVIAIEPPGGNSARKLGPFVDDQPGPERSLYWWAYARNKRSVTLDITTDEGRDHLLRLARGAHFLIESELPGRMAELGLSYEALAKVNPALVYVSISAFGQTGPKAGYAESDLIVHAAAVQDIGDADRAPVRFSVPQAYLHASADAAGAALIAHRERQRSGLGQHVDASAQQAVAQANQSLILSAAIGEQESQRVTGGIKMGGLPIPLVWPAKDGHISLLFLFGTIGPFSRRLMEWMHEEDFCDEATRDKDWIGYTALLTSGKESPQEYGRVLGLIREFTATKTKAELQEAALELRLLIAPLATMTGSVCSMAVMALLDSTNPLPVQTMTVMPAARARKMASRMTVEVSPAGVGGVPSAATARRSVGGTGGGRWEPRGAGRWGGAEPGG